MASSSTESPATITLHKRLLLDIAELQSKPYPNITLHIDDSNFTRACLILNADGYGLLHLTINFPANYPLSPPKIHMDSQIRHPNVFGSYICSSILNTTEGYTSAYTLKGIAIQLLSFFSSDTVEQIDGGHSLNLDDYKVMQSSLILWPYSCKNCELASQGKVPMKRRRPDYVPPRFGPDSELHWPSLQQVPQRTFRRSMQHKRFQVRATESSTITPSIQDMGLPDEILLLICEELDTEDLLVFAGAWDRIGALMTTYDLIRTRELQCFCLKTSYLNSQLGVGVSVGQDRKRNIESEFDLISKIAFETHKIRRSVQGVEFEHWLPLPISYSHWRKIQNEIPDALRTIQTAARLPAGPLVSVIYEFMNSIVVKLNLQASQTAIPSFTRQSSLTHASEKAIESYFHLFHLLLCLATTQPSIITSANSIIRTFSTGRVSKLDCPDLGHVLIASLISDYPLDVHGIKSLIRETITRNVVWMLTSNPELAYLEPSAVSEYRLAKTFEVSKTSYRLLMFLRLFQRVAVECGSEVGAPRKSLVELRNGAFNRHGAPPRGAASYLASSIKRIHEVSSFPEFLRVMGIKEMPSKECFTGFLRDCVGKSMVKGYSRWGISQGAALGLRRVMEPEVEVLEGLVEVRGCAVGGRSFFPGNRDTRGGMRGRGGRGGFR